MSKNPEIFNRGDKYTVPDAFNKPRSHFYATNSMLNYQYGGPLMNSVKHVFGEGGFKSMAKNIPSPYKFAGTKIYRDTTEIPNFNQGGAVEKPWLNNLYKEQPMGLREGGSFQTSYYSSDVQDNYYANGGMIKRADGSYSHRGLWDNIRANAGSGKEPTKEMLEQERKITREYAEGGPLTGNPPAENLPLTSSSNVTAEDYMDVYNNSLELQNYLKGLSSQGYEPWSPEKNESFNKMFSTPEEKWARMQKSVAGFNPATTIMPTTGTNIRQDLTLSDYYQQIDENRSKQREISEGVLNSNIPMGLYDKRIPIDSFSGYTGPTLGNFAADNVQVPMYNPVKLKEDMTKLYPEIQYNQSGKAYTIPQLPLRALDSLTTPQEETIIPAQEIPVPQQMATVKRYDAKANNWTEVQVPATSPEVEADRQRWEYANKNKQYMQGQINNRKYGGSLPKPYSFPEDSFKQGGRGLHNSIYASTPGQYPQPYENGGSLVANSAMPMVEPMQPNIIPASAFNAPVQFHPQTYGDIEKSDGTTYKKGLDGAWYISGPRAKNYELMNDPAGIWADSLETGIRQAKVVPVSQIPIVDNSSKV
jgi:hypothetical protein